MGAIRLPISWVCLFLGACNESATHESSEFRVPENIRLITPKFGLEVVRNHMDVKTTACLFDCDGQIIMRLPLIGCGASPGKFGDFQVTSNKWGASTRTVRIYDEQGRFKTSFEIDGQSAAHLGRESAVLTTRRGEGGLSSPYDLRFLDHKGKLINRHVNADRSIVILQSCDNDHWIALARIFSSHTSSFLLYDPCGRFLWEYEIELSLPTAITLSHSALHAAVVVPDESYDAISVHLLNAMGRKTVAFDMLFYPQMQFTPDDKFLLLFGESGWQLRQVADGALVASVHENMRFASGNPVRISADGKTFWAAVLSCDHNGTPQELQLRQWSLQTHEELHRKTVLDTVPEPICMILDIQATSDSIRLVTPTGYHQLSIAD